jgi:flagellar M-ring protein FliF
MALLPLNNEVLLGVRRRARTVLAGFTSGQKVMSALALVVLVVAGGVFMNMESQPNYQPLFTNLQTADAGAITAQLTSAKVPFELASGGSTVLVPANDVNTERVALAEQGLPGSGTVGFSNLEKSGVTTSQFVQQIEYQQALEGQLQQTIESIQGVRSAQVSLVVPQQSDFAIGTQQTTTASILVDLAPGTTLTSTQVQAIVHLAAAATPGLSVSNVTVVDNHGDVLSSAGATNGSSGASNTRQTANYDAQLSGSIQALLDRVVGTGNSAVTVHALLNFNQQSTTTKGLQTNAQGLPVTAQTSSTTSSQTYSGTGTPPSGVLGAGQVATSGAGKYTTTNNQVTNAVGQVTQTVKQSPGQVVSTSVAVLLNSKAKPKASPKKIQALVAAAAGLKTANGDQLVVTAMPFAKTTASPVLGTGSTSQTMQLVEHGGEVAGLVLLLAAMLFFALRSSRRSSYDEVHVEALPSMASRVLAYEDDPRVLSDPANSARQGLPEISNDAVLAQVNSYIEQRPAEVARLLRAWADEGRDPS